MTGWLPRRSAQQDDAGPAMCSLVNVPDVIRRAQTPQTSSRECLLVFGFGFGFGARGSGLGRTLARPTVGTREGKRDAASVDDISGRLRSQMRIC